MSYSIDEFVRRAPAWTLLRPNPNLEEIFDSVSAEIDRLRDTPAGGLFFAWLEEADQHLEYALHHDGMQLHETMLLVEKVREAEDINLGRPAQIWNLDDYWPVVQAQAEDCGCTCLPDPHSDLVGHLSPNQYQLLQQRIDSEPDLGPAVHRSSQVAIDLMHECQELVREDQEPFQLENLAAEQRDVSLAEIRELQQQQQRAETFTGLLSDLRAALESKRRAEQAIQELWQLQGDRDPQPQEQ